MSVPDATSADTTPPVSEGADASTAPDPSSSPDSSLPVEGDGSTTVESYVNDESLDLESSGLNEATQREIKRLRTDAKTWRETATSWNEATQGWAEEDVAVMREALAAGPSNPEAVAKWMYDSALALDPSIGGAATPVEDDDDAEPEDMATIIDKKVAEALAAVEQKQTVAQRVAKIKADSEALGFGPSHDLHEALLSIARFRTNGDLAKAADLLKAQGPVGTEHTTPQDAPPDGGHTPVPPDGATPAGTRRVSDPRQAAAERLAKAKWGEASDI